MGDKHPVDQFGRPVQFIFTPQGVQAQVVGDVLPEALRGPEIYLDPNGQGRPHGDFTAKHPNSGPVSSPPPAPQSVNPADNATLGRVYTMPMGPPPQPASEHAEGETAPSPESRPWYERAWEEAARVGSETIDGWIDGARTVWEALPGTSDPASTEAARQRIADGAIGTLEGLGTLMGSPPELINHAYMSGDPDAIALVEQMQQNQREAFGAIGDSVKEAWNAAYERNGAAGASAMVLATLGMEALGGKGAAGVARAAEKVADIVRLARTPMEAANKLDEAIAAAKAAGASADEIAVLERARAQRLAQARREAAQGKDGVAVRKGRLAPNSTYSLNGYKYTTDEHGRIKTVEGELRAEANPNRSDHMQGNVGVDDGRAPGDHGGHLIGAQFGGYEGYENLTPMAGQINAYPKGKWGQMEKNWADRIKAGDTVHVKIEVNYPDSTMRAGSFKVTETITSGSSVTQNVNIVRNPKP
ncbi:DNA/RNA non-specific endonuclease [Thauera butanivorans]|uniref:DNA/RNA non-specific endonuclease n=1 Tax=Thauera butanivorans TaxID=86174 RepID=UPI003AB54361